VHFVGPIGLQPFDDTKTQIAPSPRIGFGSLCRQWRFSVCWTWLQWRGFEKSGGVSLLFFPRSKFQREGGRGKQAMAPAAAKGALSHGRNSTPASTRYISLAFVDRSGREGAMEDGHAIDGGMEGRREGEEKSWNRLGRKRQPHLCTTLTYASLENCAAYRLTLVDIVYSEASPFSRSSRSLASGPVPYLVHGQSTCCFFEAKAAKDKTWSQHRIPVG